MHYLSLSEAPLYPVVTVDPVCQLYWCSFGLVSRPWHVQSVHSKQSLVLLLLACGDVHWPWLYLWVSVRGVSWTGKLGITSMDSTVRHALIGAIMSALVWVRLNTFIGLVLVMVGFVPSEKERFFPFHNIRVPHVRNSNWMQEVSYPKLMNSEACVKWKFWCHLCVRDMVIWCHPRQWSLPTDKVTMTKLHSVLAHFWPH